MGEYNILKMVRLYPQSQNWSGGTESNINRTQPQWCVCVCLNGCNLIPVIFHVTVWGRNWIRGKADYLDELMNKVRSLQCVWWAVFWLLLFLIKWFVIHLFGNNARTQHTRLGCRKALTTKNKKQEQQSTHHCTTIHQTLEMTAALSWSQTKCCYLFKESKVLLPSFRCSSSVLFLPSVII